MDDLHINWRGPLSSCNYDCDYCPFAKHVSSREELARDQAELARFVAWCRGGEAAARRLSILFTPWGEALIRPYYAPALVELGIRYSVGVVGLREHFELIEALRARLRPEVYLWINAYKSAGPGYYREGERERLAAIDPLFGLNAVRHETRGHSCAAGRTALFVRGDGGVSRCHFVERPLGNLYELGLAQLLRDEPCPQQTCGCFIGYVQLDRLDLRRRFGAGLAARMLPITP